MRDGGGRGLDEDIFGWVLFLGGWDKGCAVGEFVGWFKIESGNQQKRLEEQNGLKYCTSFFGCSA